MYQNRESKVENRDQNVEKIHENARNEHPKLELDTGADHTNFSVKIRFCEKFPANRGGGARRLAAAHGGGS